MVSVINFKLQTGFVMQKGGIPHGSADEKRFV